ncbi:hypothetical protein FO488_01825 [Geobacter sp. FeAm09]|uniref:hypothetical protein n=1 Tax=Geobacter sp. FeAm09 TaxID=2597769 RepID=UPI0011ED554B|nr:hypothetical protein [Geobacter sp. FeAm09]QEM67019.1 hypothetical protein FO488_01825 [Geobacter sp. FeAm09]
MPERTLNSPKLRRGGTMEIKCLDDPKAKVIEADETVSKNIDSHKEPILSWPVRRAGLPERRTGFAITCSRL